MCTRIRSGIPAGTAWSTAELISGLFKVFWVTGRSQARFATPDWTADGLRNCFKFRRAWTEGGKFGVGSGQQRGCTFLRVRPDKLPNDCLLEQVIEHAAI